MSNPAKIKGTSFESAVVGYLRQYWPTAERRALSGQSDKGDVINVPAVVECKAVRKFALSLWMDELAKEKQNAGEDIGFVVVKRPNHGVNRAYAVMELQDMAALLARKDLDSIG